MAKRSCLVLLAACLAALAPAAASGTTTLATNPAGDQVLLHQVFESQSRPLAAATRPDGGSFGPLAVLAPPPGLFDARVAVDDSGGAVAVWVSHDVPSGQRPDRGFAAIRQPGGAFGGAAQIFEEPPGRRVRLGTNAAGDAIFGWEGASTDSYAFRPAGGSFGQPAPMPTSMYDSMKTRFFRGFSVDPDGTSHAFSEQTKPDFTSDLYEATRPPGGDFGPSAPVAPLGKAYGGVWLAASRTGRVLVLWSDERTIRGMDRTPGGSFGTPFVLPYGPAPTDVEDTPSVVALAVAPSGAAAGAVNVENVARLSNRVVARTPGGPFVVSPRIKGSDPRVAVDNAGDAVAVWAVGDQEIRAIYRRAGSAHFGKPFTLVPARPGAPGFVAPTVVIDKSGRATVAWEQSDGARITVWTRDFSGSRPGRRERVASLPSFLREGPASACRPNGAQVVRSSRQATVFVTDRLFACLLARGVPVSLDNFGEQRQPSSTISLAGALVSFATRTRLRVLDLRDPTYGVNRELEVDPERAGPGGFLAATRLKANGAVAWIACTSRCTQGRRKLVFAANRGALARRLDSGRTIEPGSLRRHGSALTWRHGGKLRHARLR